MICVYAVAEKNTRNAVYCKKGAEMKKSIVILISLIFALYLYHEFKIDSNKYFPSVATKLEIVDSFIPGVKKYYVYLDYKKFKVSEKILNYYELGYDGLYHNKQ